MSRSKLSAALTGVAACAALGAFLGGVPLLLVRLVGNPLPSALPAWSSVVEAVEDGVLPSGAAIRFVAVVVWIWWSQVALSFAVEVVAAGRGRMSRALPLNAFGMQPLVVRLTAIVLAAASTLGLLAQPALAATPSFAGISVAETSEGPSAVADGVLSPAPVGAAAPSSPAALAPAAPPEPPAPVLGLPQAASRASAA
ncbi:MAG: hypothetical protein OXG52_10320, partial [bacterium]|nr:hypothetical protein [bacterium]